MSYQFNSFCVGISVFPGAKTSFLTFVFYHKKAPKKHHPSKC
jgi:hypothetical protein